MLSYRDLRADRCVYAIRHLPTGKRYIGGTNDLRTRVRKHIGDLNGRGHFCGPLQDLWRADGAAAFALDVLELVPKEASLLLAEQRRLVQDGFLLNASRDEWIASMSAAKQGERHNYYGKRRPKHTRERIAAAKVGDLNPMHGVMEGDHPQARAIVLDGVEYPAIVAASRRLGRGLSTIYYWLRTGRARYAA
jgi:hypothetical protein